MWKVATHFYYYKRECEILPLLRLNTDEALALVMAGQTFAAWGSSSLGRALLGALDKIADIVGGNVSLPASEISALISQPDDGPDANTERRWLAVALEAIRRRRELRLSYQKPRANQSEERVVHPLHLAFLEHRWMLVARDPSRRQPRNFLLGRIKQARPTGQHFEPLQTSTQSVIFPEASAVSPASKSSQSESCLTRSWRHMSAASIADRARARPRRSRTPNSHQWSDRTYYATATATHSIS